MTVKRSFLKSIVNARRLLAKKRIEKRRVAAIGGKAKRKITVTDPRALAELRKIAGVSERKSRRVQLVLTWDEKVYLLYGRNAPTKPLLLSGKPAASKIVDNVLHWGRGF